MQQATLPNRDSVGTRFETIEAVQLRVSGESDLDYLRALDEQLRAAIFESLRGGRPHLAVALDTARDSLEAVIADPDATPTRIALARAHAEIALDSWREACDVRH